MLDLYSHRSLFLSLTYRSLQLYAWCSQAGDIVTLVTLFLALDISELTTQTKKVSQLPVRLRLREKRKSGPKEP